MADIRHVTESARWAVRAVIGGIAGGMAYSAVEVPNRELFFLAILLFAAALVLDMLAVVVGEDLRARHEEQREE